MNHFRDLPNPSGADIEAFFNQQLAKLQLNLIYGAAGKGSFKAQDYDYQVTRSLEYPGPDWEYVDCLNIGPGTVGIVWRMNRVLQAERGLEPVMKIVGKKA